MKQSVDEPLQEPADSAMLFDSLKSIDAIPEPSLIWSMQHVAISVSLAAGAKSEETALATQDDWCTQSEWLLQRDTESATLTHMRMVGLGSSDSDDTTAKSQALVLNSLLDCPSCGSSHRRHHRSPSHHGKSHFWSHHSHGRMQNHCYDQNGDSLASTINNDIGLCTIESRGNVWNGGVCMNVGLWLDTTTMGTHTCPVKVAGSLEFFMVDCTPDGTHSERTRADGEVVADSVWTYVGCAMMIVVGRTKNVFQLNSEGLLGNAQPILHNLVCNDLLGTVLSCLCGFVFACDAVVLLSGRPWFTRTVLETLAGAGICRGSGMENWGCINSASSLRLTRFLAGDVRHRTVLTARHRTVLTARALRSGRLPSVRPRRTRRREKRADCHVVTPVGNLPPGRVARQSQELGN